MNIVKYEEYNSDKVSFFRKHENDFSLNVKGMSAEYYNKVYSFSDGAVWYEVSRKIYVPIEEEIYFNKIKIEVEMLETEYYNSEDSGSKYYYEKWQL